MVNNIVFFSITGFLFYLGILYRNPVMLTLGYALLVVLVLSILELLLRKLTFQCEVDMPIHTAEQGQPVSLFVKVRNKGFLPIGKLAVKVGCRNSFQKRYQYQWFIIHDVKLGESEHPLPLIMQSSGNYEIQISKVKIYSLLGILYIKKKYKAKESLLVMPKIHSMGISVSERVNQFIGDSDEYDEFRPGHDPSEVFEVRAYRPKDKLQSIHWKLSAKMDELMVKENSLPQACACVLMLDYKKNKALSAYLETAATISFCMLDSKCPHFVAWYSKEIEEIRRIRVDDEESFYLFLDVYMKEMGANDVDVRDAYRDKYKNELYLYDICVNEKLEIYRNGQFLAKLNAKTIENECKKLEILL